MNLLSKKHKPLLRRSVLTTSGAGFVLLACLGACDMLAKGSVGTDNPTVAAVDVPQNGSDSVVVQIWGEDQNPLKNPVPLYEGTYRSGEFFAVHPDSLGLKVDTWNLQVQDQAGTSIALITGFSADEKGRWTLDSEDAPLDTLRIELVAPGSALVLESPNSQGSGQSSSTREISSSSGNLPVLTSSSSLDLVLDTLVDAEVIIPLDKGNLSASQVEVYLSESVMRPNITLPSYAIVLGTGIVIPITDANMLHTMRIQGIPPGEYLMTFTDENGETLFEKVVRVI